jgi:hypothetical protein
MGNFMSSHIDIPEAIATEQAKIVTDCDAREAAIAACATVEELIAVVAPINTFKENSNAA